MAEASAITYFIWAFAAFQFVIAGWLLAVPRPGPARVVHAVLLVLNGLSSIGFGLLNAEPYRSTYAAGDPFGPLIRLLISGADIPTGAWLLILIPIFWQGSGLDTHRWTPTILTATGAATLLTLVSFAVALYRPELYVDTYYGYWTGELPLVFAYGGILYVLVRALIRADTTPERRTYALLFIAFGARVVEFVYRYTVALLFAEPETRWFLRIDDHLWPVVGLLALVLLARLAKDAARHPALERHPHKAVIATTLGVLLFTIGYWDWAHGATLYALGLLTLVLVRPLFIGLAYDPATAARISGATGIGTGAFLLIKAFAAEILDQSFWEIGRSDLVALGMVVLVAVPFFLRHSSNSPETPTPSLTHAQRLALYLYEARQRDPATPGVTSADIETALGISPNNVASEIRRVERLLREHAPNDRRLVQAQVLGIRGRKFFRLTDDGAQAAQAAARAPDCPDGGR